jgi:hypothetical protein
LVNTIGVYCHPNTSYGSASFISKRIQILKDRYGFPFEPTNNTTNVWEENSQSVLAQNSQDLTWSLAQNSEFTQSGIPGSPKKIDRSTSAQQDAAGIDANLQNLFNSDKKSNDGISTLATGNTFSSTEQQATMNTLNWTQEKEVRLQKSSSMEKCKITDSINPSTLPKPNVDSATATSTPATATKHPSTHFLSGNTKIVDLANNDMCLPLNTSSATNSITPLQSIPGRDESADLHFYRKASSSPLSGVMTSIKQTQIRATTKERYANSMPQYNSLKHIVLEGAIIQNSEDQQQNPLIGNDTSSINQTIRDGELVREETDHDLEEERKEQGRNAAPARDAVDVIQGEPGDSSINSLRPKVAAPATSAVFENEIDDSTIYLTGHAMRLPFQPSESTPSSVASKNPTFKWKYRQAKPAPPGVTDTDWNLIYHAANSRMSSKYRADVKKIKNCREEGETYGLALKILEERKGLGRPEKEEVWGVDALENNVELSTTALGERSLCHDAAVIVSPSNKTIKGDIAARSLEIRSTNGETINNVDTDIHTTKQQTAAVSLSSPKRDQKSISAATQRHFFADEESDLDLSEMDEDELADLMSSSNYQTIRVAPESVIRPQRQRVPTEKIKAAEGSKSQKNKPQYVCHRCHFKAASAEKLESHMTSHAGVGRPKLHKCEICGQRYKKLRQLKRHRQSKHIVSGTASSRPAKGTVSGEKQRRLTRSSISDQKSPNSFSKATPSRPVPADARKRRSRNISGSEDEYLLIIPGADAPTAEGSERPKRHVVATERNQISPTPKVERYKPYVCDICNRSILRKDHFDRHLNVHIREELFKCEDCGMRLGKLDELLKHQQAQHSTTTNAKFGESENVSSKTIIPADLAPESTTVKASNTNKKRQKRRPSTPIVSAIGRQAATPKRPSSTAVNPTIFLSSPYTRPVTPPPRGEKRSFMASEIHEESDEVAKRQKLATQLESHDSEPELSEPEQPQIWEFSDDEVDDY